MMCCVGCNPVLGKESRPGHVERTEDGRGKIKTLIQTLILFRSSCEQPSSSVSMTSPRHNSPGLGGRSPLLRCSQSHAALSALLHNTQLEDLLQDTPVVAFEQDTPIEEVLEVLSRHRILSAPVFLRQTDGQPSRSVQSLLGFVDVMSVLRAFIAELGYQNGGALPPAADVEAAGARLCSRAVRCLFGEAAPLHQAATTASGTCSNYGVRPASLSGTGGGGGAAAAACIDEDCPLEEQGPVPAGQPSCAIAGARQASLYDIIRDSFLVGPLDGGGGWGWSGPPAATALGRLLPHPSIHRVAVFDPVSSTVTHILSQSDIIRVLAGRQSCLGALAGRSLADLGLATSRLQLVRGGTGSGPLPTPGSPSGRRIHPLLGVSADTPTLEAFRLLLEHHVSGLAVVSGTHPAASTLVGNLSAADARCLVPGLFAALAEPVGRFLEQRPLLAAVQQRTAQALSPRHGPSIPRPDDLPPAAASPVAGSPHLAAGAGSGAAHPGSSNSSSGGLPPGCGWRVVTAQATSTLGELLGLYVRRGVHRVYVVDPDQRPVGLVTLSDVLHLVMEVAG